MKLKTAAPNPERYALLYVKKKKKNQSCVSYNIPDSVVNFFRSQINSTALCNLLLCSLPFVLQKIVYVM